MFTTEVLRTVATIALTGLPFEGGIVAEDRGRVRSSDATRDFFIDLNQAIPTPAESVQLKNLDPDDGWVIRERARVF